MRAPARPPLYLDWNASTPLRPEARTAMLSAMDTFGNPASVHAHGRAAKAMIEEARTALADALGTQEGQIIFTSGASEAAALALAGRGLHCAPIEHEAVAAWCAPTLKSDRSGKVHPGAPAQSALQLANSETGVLQDLPHGLALSDLTQAFGKIPFSFDDLGCEMGLISAHKLGGPKGIGALVLRAGASEALQPQIKGGGQEMGRRAGTENLIGIAGFAAAARAALRDLSTGVWEEVRALRDALEAALPGAKEGVLCAARGERRLPNTSCLIAEGWRGETQVMAMDLAGFSISAGSACSSGKLRPSTVLRAMGYSPEQASSAIRISIGPNTPRDELMRFGEIWQAGYTKRRKRG